MTNKISRSNKIMGMTYWQVGILFAIGTCALVSIGSVLTLIGYENLRIDTPAIQQPIIISTATNIPSSRFPTLAFTPGPTPTLLLTATITLTPTPWFQNTGDYYIPKESELPSGFRIYAPGSGIFQDEQAKYTYASYSSDYPSEQHTEDAYLVAYEVWIFNTDASALSGYEDITPEWIKMNWINWFNKTENITPIEVSYYTSGVEKSAAFIISIQGESVPGFFVLIKLQSHNGVFITKTVSHSPSGDQQRALANANYFASLLIQKLH